MKQLRKQLDYDFDRHATALPALIFGQFSCPRIHDFPEDYFFHTRTRMALYLTFHEFSILYTSILDPMEFDRRPLFTLF